MAKQKPNPYFRFQQFTIFHDKCAMKVGTDGVLLGAWTNLTKAKTALDIGTGSGLIALMLAQRNIELKIDAIDIDTNAIIQAEENVSQSPFSDRITCHKTAIQNYNPKRRYDVIVSNPPFFRNSRKSASPQRTLARHTDSLTLEDLMLYSSNMLSEDGQLSIIYPIDYKVRVSEIAYKHNLHMSKITSVFPTPQSEPKRILIELSKKRHTLVTNNLIIELERHIYSDEFNQLTENFYLKK